MTVTVGCPYCGKETIQPDARFCDRCGKELSTFWKTVGPLVRQLSDQQKSIDEQKKTALALKERVQDLESKLSASVSRSEIDAVTAKAREDITRVNGRVHELEAKLAKTVPRSELDAKESEAENLSKDMKKLSERVQDLEAKLARSVQRTELEARQSENKDLRIELSRLREDTAQSEARMTKLTGRVHELEARLAETVPKAEFEAKQFETENLRKELSRLRDDKAKSETRIKELSGEPERSLQSAPALKVVSSGGLLLADNETPDDSSANLPRSTRRVAEAMVSCYVHTQRQASNTCAVCRKEICGECSNWAAEKLYVCGECWKSIGSLKLASGSAKGTELLARIRQRLAHTESRTRY